MDVFEAIRTRRSIKAYENRPVEKEEIDKVLEAARLSPSAGNKQPWRFIVVTEPEVKANLRSAKMKLRPPPPKTPPREPPKDPLHSAPVLIVGCALPSDSFPGTDFWKIDVAIALQNLVLAAWEQGLGTCWIGVFHEEEEVKKVLGLPKEARVIAMISLGYPSEKKDPVTDRKPLEAIVRYNHWQ